MAAHLIRIRPSLAKSLLFAGDFAPGGFAFAHGQLLAINGNEALFSLLGTQYGGDALNSFALPDFRNRTAIDESANNQVGTVQGENFTTIEAADIAELEETPSFVVTTLDDVVTPLDGETSLREAVQLANDTAGQNEISFDPSLSGGTLRLTQGDLDITDALQISGDPNGDFIADITISGDATGNGTTIDDSRIFDVNGASLSLYSLNLAGGFVQNGNGGLVSVTNGGTFSAFVGDFSGGEVTRPRARIPITGYGGAIYNGGGELYLVNVAITDSTATYAGGGIGVNSADGETRLVNVTIANNTATLWRRAFDHRRSPRTPRPISTCCKPP